MVKAKDKAKDINDQMSIKVKGKKKYLMAMCTKKLKKHVTSTFCLLLSQILSEFLV